MSLLWNRRRLRKAVSGELGPAEELRLRQHLSGCASCRGYYDRLVVTARAMRGDLNATRTEAARTEARLRSLLGSAAPGRSASSAAPTRARFPFRLAPAFALASVLVVAGGALVLRMRGEEHATEGLRGGPEARVAAGSLWAHARSREGGPVRVVAEFPGAGEAQVSQREYVQFGLRNLTQPGYVAVAGVDDGGAVHLYYPQSGDGRIEPVDGRVRLGRSIDFAIGHDPGVVRLFLVVSSTPIPPEAATDVRALTEHPEAREVGVLKVVP